MNWKPVIQNVKGLAKGGAIPESFNQIPSTAPELLSSAGAQRSSPAEYLQSQAESFNAEQNWRKGHQLTNMQKERVAEEQGQLQDAGKYLGMDVGLGTREPYQSYDAPVAAPPPLSEDEPYQMQPLQRRKRPSIMESGLGTSSLLGLQRGGTIDYRNGGTVAGGPPGVDTIPVVAHPGGPVKAMLSNGEYALPTGTVAAVGKPALDQLVIATTGQKPVGYWMGGLMDKIKGRKEQIDKQVDQAVVTPPPPSPKGEEQVPSMAEIMKEIRKKNPPVQGYNLGGMTELERKRMQATDPRYAVAVGERPDVVRGAPAVMLDPQAAVARTVPPPMRYAPTMAGGNLVAEPATPGAAVVATAADRVPDYVERPRPPMPRGGVQPYGQSMPEVRSAPTTYAAMPEAPPVSAMPAANILPQETATPDERPGSIGSRIVTPVLQAIFSAREDPEYAQDRADRTQQAVPSTTVKSGAAVAAVVPPGAAAKIQSDVAAVPTDPMLDPTKKFAEIPGAYKPGLEQASGFTKTMTPAGVRYSGPQGFMQSEGPGTGGPSPLDFSRAQMAAANANARAGGGGGFLGTVGGAPYGVFDADYAKMSLAEKSAAKVKSMEDATAAIRSLRNARREAEGLPPVGGDQSRLAGLKPGEQIAYANLMRGLSNDQRAAVQDDFMNRLRVDERLEGRQKASAAAQDRRMEQAAPFMETMGADFPGLEGSGPMFFQQTSRLGVEPERAYQTLAGTYEMMRQSTDTEPLFTVAGQDVTPAQAIAILNGETPFDNAWRLQWGGKELYDEIRRVAAQKVQELALRGLAK